MKPYFVIIPKVHGIGYEVCSRVEITCKDDHKPTYKLQPEFEGSLDYCTEFIITQAHHAGYMEAAKKAINAISEVL